MNIRRQWCLLLLALQLSIVSAIAAKDPFGVDVRRISQGNGDAVSVTFIIPPNHHVYADQYSVQAKGSVLPAIEAPIPVTVKDSFSGENRQAYTSDFTAIYRLPDASESVDVAYQGCDESTCFFPQVRTFRLTTGQTQESQNAGATRSKGESWGSVEVAGQAAGYLRTAEFLMFLDRVEGKESADERGGSFWGRLRDAMTLFGADPLEFFKQYGVWWTFVVIILGGLLLNLTPCVLPMIPINLAIIGVGSQDGSKLRGFALGGAYGLGMALVYGVLGLLVVLTGSQFGALNSSPGFNAVMALVFVLLGLAMFDVIAIDFSRFQGQVGGNGWLAQKGNFLVALIMGGIAALLAGACVAPVVIAVLLLSGKLYAAGAVEGVLLPFVLGVGMALPWPLAGAGLSFLPKPGGWMTWVKRGFGAFIVALAVYYGLLAYQGWSGVKNAQPMTKDGEYNIRAEDHELLRVKIMESLAIGRPVFLDFWATWCKNCHAMDATTFRDKAVQARLKDYVVIKVQAEKPDDVAARDLLERFSVKGLPTYVVVKPTGKPEVHDAQDGRK